MKRLHLALVAAFAVLAAGLPSPARAVSSYYSSECAGCHGSTPTTCNGCHQHGPGNLTGAISGTSFTPGQGFNVTVNSGSRTGWWRAAVLDASNNVIGQTTMSATGTATIAVTAPSAAGSYTWKAAWYGNQRSASTPSGSTWVPDAGNSGHGYKTVNLTTFTVGAAAAPKAALSQTTLAFGNVTVGQTSTLTTAAVRNTGTAALSVTGVTACSNTAPPFGISPSAAFSVAAGGSQTLTVSFAPTSTGAVSGCFNIATNDPTAATLTLNVSGTGAAVPVPSASLTPAALAFGSVTVGQTSSLTATVRNTGSAALAVTGAAACDSSNAASLTISPTAAFSVAAGASQTLTVRFAPTAAGAAAACWNLATNDASNPSLQLRATGTGAAVPVTLPNATLAPTSLAFGDVTVGQTKALTAAVGNTGTAALSVTGVAPCATNPASLTIAPTAAFTVAAGGSQVLTVTFAPAAAGAAAGCWNVATNDAAHPSLQLNVTGNGIAATTTCGTCHAVPPATGKHDFHVSSAGASCGDCHGTGYSSTTVNATTHQNGSVNLATSAGWNSSAATCANACHGSKSWGTVVTPPPTSTCGSCHAIPPSTGKHSKHKSEGVSCGKCHGTGFSPTTVNASVHNNGVKNVASGAGWKPSTASCANSCHGSEKWGTTPSTNPPPTNTCGSCHAIPPNTGRHAMHKSEGVGCARCHGSGYTATTVAAAAHLNGKVNMTSSSGWRVATRSCANSCHGTEKWSTSSSGSHDEGDDHDDSDFVITADEAGSSGGGCSSAGGSTTLFALLGIAALGLLRRRRQA